MAVRVRQQSYIYQPVAPPTTPQPTIKTVKKKKLITTKEKLLYIAFVMVVCVLAVTILHKQSIIQQSTIEIQKIQSQVTDLSNENVDLKVKVAELSTYDRIMEKAKALGLTLNEKNVKVVPGE
ncbi:cell division protein [Ureibacillus massiliensis 4400831 = CIP 108448 = CCUG 49529]|uniref:Cell division protein FtsL n=1 Tax=Ureibacillus massiliensis 4400831 = CIP 108448 = CCUG 49529 TaxID=1211035 RepID=A0A0A3J5G0_9BACL|nr:cell division protein FtsL [Ureibacillus massiliensis]KGR92166.1 cell division protein [Ureibacillus massiliensis 4400831 = CIP 108448 = CCUG 49529]